MAKPAPEPTRAEQTSLFVDVKVLQLLVAELLAHAAAACPEPAAFLQDIGTSAEFDIAASDPPSFAGWDGEFLKHGVLHRIEAMLADVSKRTAALLDHRLRSVQEVPHPRKDV